MKIRWTILLLVASLAFNLAFIVSNLHNKARHTETVPVKNGLYIADLDLEMTQKKRLDIIIKKSRIDLSQFKQDILGKRIEVVEELSNPDYDPEALKKKIDELNQLENLMNHAFIDSLIQANNLLNPEQRLSFMVGLGKNWFRLQGDRGENRPRNQGEIE